MQIRGWAHKRNRLYMAQRGASVSASVTNHTRLVVQNVKPRNVQCASASLQTWKPVPAHMNRPVGFSRLPAETNKGLVPRSYTSQSFCIMQKEAQGPLEAGKHLEAPRYVCSWTKTKIWSREIREKLKSCSCTMSKPQLNIRQNVFVQCNREYTYTCARPFQICLSPGV